MLDRFRSKIQLGRKFFKKIILRKRDPGTYSNIYNILDHLNLSA